MGTKRAFSRSDISFGNHASSISCGFMSSSAKTDFVQGGFQPNVEELLKLRPDVVFQWADKGDDILAPMEQAGIPVIGLTYGSQEDLETWMALMGDVLAKPERAEDKHNEDGQAP